MKKNKAWLNSLQDVVFLEPFNTVEKYARDIQDLMRRFLMSGLFSNATRPKVVPSKKNQIFFEPRDTNERLYCTFVEKDNSRSRVMFDGQKSRQNVNSRDYFAFKFLEHQLKTYIYI